MEEAHVFTIDVAQDARQLGRDRWSVSENMKLRDTSFYSFATRREAQADADKFVEMLKAFGNPTNDEDPQRREKAWPTPSTVGTRKAARQPYVALAV
jgi:hypothetical protein